MDINNIDIEEMGYEFIEVSEEDEKEIRDFAENGDPMEKIVGSIAPSIYGMQVEKEALALQLFGGVRKEYEDNTKVRGDIHILMIGDPGTAKSQLLRYTADLAPRGVYASGKSSSAAGLTAAFVNCTTIAFLGEHCMTTTLVFACLVAFHMLFASRAIADNNTHILAMRWQKPTV